MYKIKTTYMSISQNDNDDSSIQVGSYLFEKVTSYKYLGVNINSKNNAHKGIKEQVGSTNRCCYIAIKIIQVEVMIEKIENNSLHKLPVTTVDVWMWVVGYYKR